MTPQTAEEIPGWPKTYSALTRDHIAALRIGAQLETAYPETAAAPGPKCSVVLAGYREWQAKRRAV